MLTTLFLMKVGQFMLLPFLAIYLVKNSHLNTIIISFIIGSGPFIYGITGFAAGVLVDKFGVKRIMILSLLLGGLCSYFFFFSQTALWYFLINVLTGITRSLFDVASKTYGISGTTSDLRKLCFSLRFMVVNSAAAIGPIIGAYFATRNSLLSFKIISMLYIFLGLLSIFILRETNNDNSNNSQNTVSFREMIHILFTDNRLKLLLLISFIIWCIYSQLDSTLPQYLNANMSNGINIYTLYATNNKRNRMRHDSINNYPLN